MSNCQESDFFFFAWMDGISMHDSFQNTLINKYNEVLLDTLRRGGVLVMVHVIVLHKACCKRVLYVVHVAGRTRMRGWSGW